MTTYFIAVLRASSFACGQSILIGDEDPTTSTDYDFFISYNSRFEPEHLGNRRCIKIVRDPRDIVVSGYFYHLWTHEEWANTRWNGNPSLVEKLNSMDLDDGLTNEIHRFSKRPASTLRSWSVPHENVLHVKYEDLLSARFEDLIDEMADHWQLVESERDFFIRSMRLFSYENRTGRPIGSELRGSHLRGGASGGWKRYFSKDHEELFEALMGDILDSYAYR